MNDIAIIKLSQKINITDARVRITILEKSSDISLATSGTKVTAVGWGLTAEGGSTSPDLLQVDLTIDTVANCDKEFSLQNYDNSKQICNTPETNKGTCQVIKSNLIV